MSSKYGSMNLPELRSELRKRAAKTSGRKKELIERLEAYDRNSNFGRPESLENSEYNMTIPDLSGYMDLNSDRDFPNIDIKKIRIYLENFEKELETDARNLYKENYLQYIRHCKSGDFHFVRSSCRAEMKRHVTYTVDLSLFEDGHVNEAQCECASGMGPHAHCKHVCALLYGCSVFDKSGHVRVEETCTQKLQKFHQVKKYLGSPLKAVDLNMPGSAEASSSLFDPRPHSFKNNPGYNAYLQNICHNFKGISKMPIFQLYPPANVLAYAHDHDYLKDTPEHMFLSRMGLTKMSNQQSRELEMKTRGQADNKLWHDERLKRLQSSNFGRICKATDRTDFVKLARSLLIRRNLKTDAVMHGKKYEQEAISTYEKDHGVSVSKCGVFVSTSHPYIGASPDGVLCNDKICEVKCPFSAKNKSITSVTVPYLKKSSCELMSDYTLSKTHDYYYQIQGQLFCSNRMSCELIVYTISDVVYLHIERDNDFIQDMLKKLESFYSNYFEPALLEKLFYKPF